MLGECVVEWFPVFTFLRIVDIESFLIHLMLILTIILLSPMRIRKNIQVLRQRRTPLHSKHQNLQCMRHILAIRSRRAALTAHKNTLPVLIPTKVTHARESVTNLLRVTSESKKIHDKPTLTQTGSLLLI